MERLSVGLNELPDEILLLIFKKLDNTDVLYSFIGVNKRLNKLVHDSIFTNHLTTTRCYPYDGPPPKSCNPVLDRFCSQILPSIRHKIKWLDVKPSSMERILLCTNYPNLHGLTLCDIKKETALCIFTDKSPLVHIFQNQISSLVIDFVQNEPSFVTEDGNANLFASILSVFSKLQCFHFGRPPFHYQRLWFKIAPTIFSSTLLELHVRLEYFTDCLYLLDGRFDQLRRLSVNIYYILLSPQIIIDNRKQLTNLKFFSLCSKQSTAKYNQLIVPLLHRMINLEELDLHLVVSCENRFIDGCDLKNNIINHLLRLNKFVFNIRSRLPLNKQVYLFSNEDCQLSFNDFKNNKIISCVDYFPNRNEGQCHIYSYPYHAKYYGFITNNFPDGLFKYVRIVSLYDERPFEHEFFVKIAKAFPFMKELTVNNDKPQKNKFDEQSKDDNRHLSVVQYPYLSAVNFFCAHDDYVEQFLLNIKTCLTTKLTCGVDFSTLNRITHNFTRDATRTNCAKILGILVPRNISISKQLRDYFPDTDIYSFVDKVD